MIGTVVDDDKKTLLDSWCNTVAWMSWKRVVLVLAATVEVCTVGGVVVIGIDSTVAVVAFGVSMTLSCLSCCSHCGKNNSRSIEMALYISS